MVRNASGFSRPRQGLAFVIDNCTSHGLSQTGGDEGVTGEETESKRGNLGERRK